MLKELLSQANGELRVSQGREKVTATDLVGQKVKIDDAEKIEITDSITGEVKELIVIGSGEKYFMAGSNLLDKIVRLENLTNEPMEKIFKDNVIHVDIESKKSKNNRNYINFKLV